MGAAKLESNTKKTSPILKYFFYRYEDLFHHWTQIYISLPVKVRWLLFNESNQIFKSFHILYNHIEQLQTSPYSRCSFSVLLGWANAIKVWANAIKVWANAIKVWDNAIKIQDQHKY